MPLPRAALAESVLDRIGTEIVGGAIQPGDSFTLQDLTERFAVSRTVAREAMRALEELSIVTARPRVGITVQAPDKWNVFSPRLIAWRLQSAQRAAQLGSLTELRAAVEPAAARHAAVRSSDEERKRLVELGAALRRLGESGAGHGEEFLRTDIEYHTLLLTSSGNEMFAALAGSIAEVLIGRTRLGLQAAHPEPEALDRHTLLAQAIHDRDPAAAEQHARALVHEVRDALTHC